MNNHALHDAIRSARIYDLGQPYWWGMPVHPADPPFLSFLYRYHDHSKDLFTEIAPGFADAISLITTSMHAGTHLDAPIHMSRDLKVLGHDITPYQQDKGFVNLPAPLHSMEKVPPLVLRTILLDVAAFKKVDVLPERYEITPQDLQQTMREENVEIKEGDCVLVRTGYSRYFETNADAYLHRFAGLGAASATWLAARKIKLFGIDNLAIGVPKPFDCHNIFLTDHGIYVMKSLALEDLAKDMQFISTIFVLVLKIKGGEASLVRPIALA